MTNSTPDASQASLIALDWGSSHLRAYLMDAHGTVLARRDSEAGASRLHGGAPAFEAALRSLVAEWLSPTVTVLACGMVGSAHGWREARYAACPLALDGLHQHLTPVAFDGVARLFIVPGLCDRSAPGLPDVMRGEETQLLGLLSNDAAWAQAATVVMPGTHSKWAHIEGGRLMGFKTRMTGELFALLREHSVLQRLMAPTTTSSETLSEGHDGEAFARGVAVARDAGGADLARLLFSVRTLGLFEDLPGSGLADYLSGLLIGAELVAGLRERDAAFPIVLVGASALCARYRSAFSLLGRDAVVAQGPLAAQGLWHIAQRAGW